MTLRPWHLIYVALLAILATLLMVKVVEGQDREVPPDLTHIDKHGISFTLVEQVIGVHEKDKVVYDLFVYKVTAKVTYEDAREPWVVTLGECSDIDESKASREAYELGQVWFKKIKKAIVEDAHKRGH